MTSIDIVRGLQEYELDGALTYIDGEPLGEVTTLPLFEERYVLVTPKGGPFAGEPSVAWHDAASLRLCLQDQSMQNRRILDAVFADIGVEMDVGLETNSIYAACTHVRQGGWSSIIPEVFAPTLADAAVDTFPLVAPDVSKLIGLVVHERTAQPPIVAAFWDASQAWRANLAGP